ncbi:MAG: lysophospholipase [Gloeocapsa sp. UFS-A4-WI-NPMV-4B04]|jgi:dienelactone hydrolase|nr:lysophospholipase [Gloeocapsa sp. UFS-A4-WI-NPMV-4B04]
MTRQRLFGLIVALLLIVLSWWGVVSARSGLVVQELEHNKVPMLYVAPQEGDKLPGVLVAHGFAGSKQLMLGYAHVLAHAGYAVMLWDFGGHGANASPFESLQHDLDIAYNALLEQPKVEKGSLALLGHSMGSGAVMSASISNPNDFAATVAVSPTGAQVTRFAPRNLLLQAGSREGSFIANAERLLVAAGGENKNLASGKGRSLEIIPNAEHITILFRNASHQSALRWLDDTFAKSHTSNYVDRRMLWYGLHLLAWLLLLGTIAPFVAAPATTYKVMRPLTSWGGLLIAPFVASGVLNLFSRVGEIESLGGLMVGGAVGIWFFVAGIVWLSILFHLPNPTLRAVGIGIAFFGLLWVAFGAIAQVVWLQWWLIPPRLLLWPLLSLACLPWFVASGVAQQSAGIGRRVGWWLGQSTALIVGLYLALYLLPQLSFIFLLLPLFPPLIGILSFAAAQLNEVWSYALGSAMFFGWMLAAAFPLAG